MLKVSVIDMDGQFNKLEELIYVERNLNNISTQFCGKITQQMMRHADLVTTAPVSFRPSV